MFVTELSAVPLSKKVLRNLFSPAKFLDLLPEKFLHLWVVHGNVFMLGTSRSPQVRHSHTRPVTKTGKPISNPA